MSILPNTIRKKIIVLSLTIWIIMAFTWLYMSYTNQKTITKYNDILQRYLLIYQVSLLSESSVSALSQYISFPEKGHLTHYKSSLGQLEKARDQLIMLKNPDNFMKLVNYNNMIRNQVHSMDLAVLSVDKNRHASIAIHINEAVQTSNFISEASLSLISDELTTYDEFYRKMIKQSNELKKIGILVLILSSILLLSFSYRFASIITLPIFVLNRAARDFAQGNFEKPILINTNDEISSLAVTFDRMRVDIKNLIGEIRNKALVERQLHEHKLLLRESELKSLQSQINPHFLFNTLNLLSKMTYLEGAKESSRLIVSVSNLLRHNLRRLDISATLEEEVKGVQEYFQIQKARFLGRFHASMEMNPECAGYEIPSLTLQPFVENAFIHGIEPSRQGGQISVRISNEPDHVVIRIEDDGCGMNRDIAESLLDETTGEGYTGHSTGIGIANVIRRLRLFYETHDVIHIESVVGKGTSVTLRLPKQRRDLDAESHDRG